ncbi:S8 family serine peptidase [Spirillospora sp. CA-255316]
MSHAGRRRRAARARRTVRPGVAFAATTTALTLVAAFAVPAATLSGGTAAAERQAAPGDPAQQAAAAPVDQIRAREWHLNAMRVPRAWRLSKGAGVTVAVLDTGVDRRHPDLVGRVTTGPDLTGGTRRPGSRYWGLHGTSMASIIAGHGNGPGQQRGVIGVAPQSRILSIRVTWENDDPQRQEGGQVARNRDAVAQGIRYAVDHGADIINMSLGGGRLFYDGNSTEESAIRYALSKGVVLIASAGNDGAGPNRNNFPAAYKGVIAVGALDRRLRMWKDSNRRPYVAVCAPGVEIVSADSSSGYVIGTGTSPSSAIVAGVAALIRARHPRLRPEEVRQALVKGVLPNRPTGSPTCAGPLDAVRALAAAGRIEQTAHGPGAKPAATSATPAPSTAPPEEDGGLLLTAVLAGGSGLIAIGVLLAWRQRRRPEDGYDDDYDDMDDYGLGARRPSPQVGAMAGRGAPRGPAVAPVNAPLWQSNEVYSGMPPAASDRVPQAPPSRNGGAPPWPPPSQTPTQEPLQAPRASAPQPQPPSSPTLPPLRPEEPEPPVSSWRQPPPAGIGPPAPSELRPYLPESPAGRGTNGYGANGFDTNGHETNGHETNGHHTNGHGAVNGSHNLGHLNGSAPSPQAAEPPPPSYEEHPRYEEPRRYEEPARYEEPVPYEEPPRHEEPVPYEEAPPGGAGNTDYTILDDEEWEKFRRSALEGSGFDDEDDRVPQEEKGPGDPFPPLPADPPPPVRPEDEHGGRPRSGEDDDYRPPWW